MTEVLIRRAPMPADRFMIVSNDFMRGQLPIPLRALARVLLGHTLSLPDGWTLDRTQLDASVMEGRDAVSTALSELEGAGYLARVRTTGPRGRWLWSWHITDDPIARPLTVQPSTESQSMVATSGNSTDPQVAPSTGSPATDDQSISKKTVFKKTEEKTYAPSAPSEDGTLFDTPEPVAPSSPSKPVVYSEAFEDAWVAYGRKGAKRAAWAEWQRAIQRADVEVIVAGIAPYLASKPDRTYRKDFERWLKGDVWESADAQPADAAPPMGTMTIEQADAWLGEQYRSGNVAAVAKRTGHAYEPPPSFSAAHDKVGAEYLAADRKDWIKRNRVGLRRVLMGQSFSNGNEVQS